MGINADQLKEELNILNQEERKIMIDCCWIFSGAEINVVRAYWMGEIWNRNWSYPTWGTIPEENFLQFLQFCLVSHGCLSMSSFWSYFNFYSVFWWEARVQIHQWFRGWEGALSWHFPVKRRRDFQPWHSYLWRLWRGGEAEVEWYLYSSCSQMNIDL